ncbi:MAG TPA: hypothetical protein VG869_15560 [Acidimicrobiia bacterium]|nr:hypothetical protein [Acidimicrobiia bacterium]
MSAFELTGADEGRHQAGAEPLWGESWYHDFAAVDGSYGGYLRLGLYPNLGVLWYWLHLVRRGEPLVLIRDHAVPCLAPGAPLEVTGDRFRASWRCTEPLQAWRITTEGTGVAVRDPAAAFHGEEGPDVDVRVDLEWRGAAPTFPYTETTRYEQAAWVAGEVVVGDQRLEVRCPGERDHSWGVRDWWAFPWLWTAGRLEDGTWFHAVRSLVAEAGDANFQTGFVVGPDGALRPLTRVAFTPRLDDEKLLVHGDLELADLGLAVTAELQAPVLLVAPDGRESRFPRALSRFEAADGRVGRGWTELNWPDGWPR